MGTLPLVQQQPAATATADAHLLRWRCQRGSATCAARVKGLIGWVARSGVPAVEADASLHLAYSRTHETALLGRSPVLCLPLGAGSLGVGSSVVGGSREGAGTPSRSKSVTLPPQPELSSTSHPRCRARLRLQRRPRQTLRLRRLGLQSKR